MSIATTALHWPARPHDLQSKGLWRPFPAAVGSPMRGLLVRCLVASALWMVGSAAAAPLAYVLNGSSQSLGVLDAASDTLAAVVPLGAPPSAMSVSADGARIFVASAAAATVSVIDGATHTLIATLPLASAPVALAVSPDGTRLYTMSADGLLQVLDAVSGAPLGGVTLPASGPLAVSPDGSRLFVAAGAVHVIDTGSLTLLASISTGADHAARQIVLAPGGSQAWIAYTAGLFTGGVLVLDTASQSVLWTLPLGAIPGQIALAPDGSRAYVGIQATWVDTGYGAGFFPGRSVVVVDALTRSAVAGIDLGASGSNWTQQNTASGIAVTPDRATVFVSVPRLAAVAAASVNQNTVRATIATGSSRGLLAAARTGAAWLPYTLDAADDTGHATTLGGVALPSVLANDRFGGIVPTLQHVRLKQLSSSHPGVTLKTGSGAVRVAAGTPAGAYALTYRLCERAAPARCDDASIEISVAVPTRLVAADDIATAYAGTPAALNVLTNDRLGGAPASAATTRLTLLGASHPGLTLSTADGTVSIAAGMPLGAQQLRYRLCEGAVPANCDTATARINVIARAIAAGDDSGATTRSGGRALASVLANDTLAARPATAANVVLSQQSSSEPGVVLNTADGSVNVAAGTPAGGHSLFYRICERASPGNCAAATVTVSVAPYLIDAVGDSARASSKRANTALASVLANDRLAGAPASVGAVTLSQVSLTPSNAQIRLDTTDGSVDVLGKTRSGRYQLVYRLCEAANPSNCDEANVDLDLSGGD